MAGETLASPRDRESQQVPVARLEEVRRKKKRKHNKGGCSLRTAMRDESAIIMLIFLFAVSDARSQSLAFANGDKDCCCCSA